MLDARIGVATAYGRPYYRFSTLLKKFNLSFDSLLPGEIPKYTGHLVLTTYGESLRGCKMPVLFEDILAHHPAVARGLMMQKIRPDFEDEDLVLGIDPGQRTGLSVSYCGMEIDGSFHSSVEALVDHIAGIMSGLDAGRRIVKIGNENMHLAGQIASMLGMKRCPPFKLEFVDEQNTSLKIKNFNQRGRRDILSARYISRREGYVRSETRPATSGTM